MAERIAEVIHGHHPVEIQPPDIAKYKQGNTGVDYVHSFDSGRAGPTVMVQALTHGNEFCGAHALDYFFRNQIKPTTGKVIVAFANVDAYARFDFDDPDASRYIDEDYNRVWADDVLFGVRDSIELRRARKLRPFVDAADFLLDIHSMHEPCRPIMVCGMVDKHVELARKVGLPADLLLDTGHPAACACATAAASTIRESARGGVDRMRPALGKVRRRRCSRYPAALSRRYRKRALRSIASKLKVELPAQQRVLARY